MSSQPSRWNGAKIGRRFSIGAVEPGPGVGAGIGADVGVGVGVGVRVGVDVTTGAGVDEGIGVEVGVAVGTRREVPVAVGVLPAVHAVIAMTKIIMLQRGSLMCLGTANFPSLAGRVNRNHAFFRVCFG